MTKFITRLRAIQKKTTKDGHSIKPSMLSSTLLSAEIWGGREGVDETIWPQKMEVDYVKVYQ